jgi:hypothetical protein
MTTHLPDETYDYLTKQLASELIEAASRFAYRNGLPRVDLTALRQASTSPADWAQLLMMFGLDAWPASIAECVGEKAA